jgi:hypothetical protein
VIRMLPLRLLDRTLHYFGFQWRWVCQRHDAKLTELLAER